MSKPEKKYTCADCGKHEFSFYSDTLLTCVDCGQMKDLPDLDRLTKENEALRQKNDNWLERCEGLNTEVVDHQFQNDCRSGSEVCACSEKNGYPCYRHIDFEYRRLFELNTTVTAENEALKACEEFAQCCLGKDHPCPLNVNGGYCCAVSCQYRVLFNKAINHKEPLPAHPGCCDICDTGGCCKEESEES